MLSPIVLNALIAGGLLSLLLGPLGCFVVWRRMAYFGDAVSHAALLGVALSFVGDLPLTPAIFLVTLIMASLLAVWMKDTRYHADTLLGFLAHGMLAIGLVIVALSDQVQVDMNAFLFGDILTVSREEIITIGCLIVVGLGLLWRYWDGLVLSTLDPQLASVEGHRAERMNYILVALVAATVAVSIKIVGVLLITALLIMPAAAARPLSSTPRMMALIAIAASLAAMVGGIASALELDAPTGPMIVVVATMLAVFTNLVKRVVGNRA